MKRYLILILVCFLMAGCKTTKRSPASLTFWKIQKDTVYIPRDTTIVSPADSCLLEAMLECDSIGQAHIFKILTLEEGLKVKQRVKIIDNILTVAARVDTASIVAAWQQMVVSVKEEKVETIVERVNFVRSYQWFFIYSGGVFWLLLIGRFAIMIIKKAMSGGIF